MKLIQIEYSEPKISSLYSPFPGIHVEEYLQIHKNS